MSGWPPGVALGAHFGFWISLLDYTSLAASVVLVSTQPVLVAILAYQLLGERTSPLFFAGILIAPAGTAATADDDSIGSAAICANALALVGAITVAIYVLIGRSSRNGGVGVLPYSIVVYFAAALTLLGATFLFGARLWGLYRGDLVLASGDHTRTSDHGPHRLQFGAALRRGLNQLGYHPRRTGGIGASRLIDTLRKAWAPDYPRRRGAGRPLPATAWLQDQTRADRMVARFVALRPPGKVLPRQVPNGNKLTR